MEPDEAVAIGAGDASGVEPEAPPQHGLSVPADAAREGRSRRPRAGPRRGPAAPRRRSDRSRRVPLHRPLDSQPPGCGHAVGGARSIRSRQGRAARAVDARARRPTPGRPGPCRGGARSLDLRPAQEAPSGRLASPQGGSSAIVGAPARRRLPRLAPGEPQHRIAPAARSHPPLPDRSRGSCAPTIIHSSASIRLSISRQRCPSEPWVEDSSRVRTGPRSARALGYLAVRCP